MGGSAKMAPLRGPVAAVTFDLDFTLWDLTGVIELAERRAHDWLRAHAPDVAERWSSSALVDLRQDIARRRAELRHDVTALRRAVYREAAARCGCAGGALERLVEGAFHAFLAGRHEVVMYPDTTPLLDSLHGRVRLGAITNGNADIARLGLERYFDFALSAVDLGAAKPSHLVFDTARNRAGVPAARIVHVGDDPESDVFGASRAGFQAVWLNRDGARWPDDLAPAPHTEVDSLETLGRLLGRVL